jgi:ankyrin repeat protein
LVFTALHNAASHGRKAIAELLLAYGADVNAKDMLSHTPLHNAESKGQNDLAELLRKHGGK